MSDELRVVSKLTLPAPYYPAITLLCKDNGILPDLVEVLEESAIEQMLKIVTYGPLHPMCWFELKLTGDEWETMKQFLDPQSNLGIAIQNGLDLLNVYETTKDMEDGLPNAE